MRFASDEPDTAIAASRRCGKSQRDWPL